MHVDVYRTEYQVNMGLSVCIVLHYFMVLEQCLVCVFAHMCMCVECSGIVISSCGTGVVHSLQAASDTAYQSRLIPHFT